MNTLGDPKCVDIYLYLQTVTFQYEGKKCRQGVRQLALHRTEKDKEVRKVID
jgi:hypothetical protein